MTPEHASDLIEAIDDLETTIAEIGFQVLVVLGMLVGLWVISIVFRR